MMKNTVRAALIATALAVIFGPATPAEEDEWHFGIGTGFFALNIDGDQGLATVLGPVRFDASLDTSEVQDLLESAIGLGGYAAKGKWVILYSAAQLELEGDLAGTGPLGNPATAVVTFTGSGAELAATYRFALKGKHAWSVLGGVRFTKHEWDFDLAIDDDPPNPPATLMRNIDQDWTDVLIGLAHGTQLNEKWTWGSRVDAGFGDSEGTYFFNTSFNWQFAKSWTLGFYGQITSIEFENDNPGDPDWYFYDADEFGVGFNILYTW